MNIQTVAETGFLGCQSQESYCRHTFSSSANLAATGIICVDHHVACPQQQHFVYIVARKTALSAT